VLYTLQGHRSSVTGIWLLRECKMLLSASHNDQRICCWDLKNASRVALWTTTLSNYVCSITADASEQLVAIGSKGFVDLLATETGREKRRLDGRHHFILSLAFSRNSLRLAGSDCQVSCEGVETFSSFRARERLSAFDFMFNMNEKNGNFESYDLMILCMCRTP